MTSMASSDVSNTTNSGRANTKSFSKLWDFSASEDFSVNVTPPPAFPPPPPPPPTSTSTSDVPMDTASNSSTNSDNKNSPTNMSVSEPNLYSLKQFNQLR